MKVVAKTDEYTIYQRRDERYAVKDENRQWINGDAKVAILVEHKLIDAAVPKAAPEAPAEEAAAEEEVAAEAEAAAEDESSAEAEAATEDESAAEAEADESEAEN